MISTEKKAAGFGFGSAQLFQNVGATPILSIYMQIRNVPISSQRCPRQSKPASSRPAASAVATLSRFDDRTRRPHIAFTRDCSNVRTVFHFKKRIADPGSFECIFCKRRRRSDEAVTARPLLCISNSTTLILQVLLSPLDYNKYLVRKNETD